MSIDFSALTDNEDFQLFNAQLQQFLGVDAQTLHNYVAIVQQQQRDMALQPLKQEWGDEFDTRMDSVRQLWEKLPENERAIYDSVEGVRFLAARVQAQQPTAEQPAAVGGSGVESATTQPGVPSLDRKTVPSALTTGAPQYRYTRSQLTSMPKNEYVQQQADIAKAYSEGAVDMSS